MNDNTTHDSADEFDTGTDYDALSDWAENEMNLPTNSATAQRGPDAAAAGKALLERVGGRPSLDPNAAPGTISPVRQVRLPETLNNRLTALAAQQGRKPSEIIRDAIAEYTDTHSTTA